MIDVAAVPPDEPLRVILGAGEQRWPGWVPTHKGQLDLTVRDDWQRSFATRRPDRLLCEHVWEHLTPAEASTAARNCFDFLAPGGTLRIAVPDANFRDEAYQRLRYGLAVVPQSRQPVRPVTNSLASHARAAACDLAFAVTDIGVPSSRNLQRAGFRLAYNYVMLVRDVGLLTGVA